MKELDILLEHFIEHNQQTLAQGHWPEFEGLLETEDDILWDWLQDSSNPSAQPYRQLLEQIRSDRA